jgi:hypothetical protein
MKPGEVAITLTRDEQLLLLAQEMNDHPGWRAIAGLIRKAQESAK